MARRQLRKFSIPAIQIRELLELEPLFPEMKFHLSVILLTTVFIGQIRVSLQTVKPNVIQRLESVNSVTRLALAKSPSLTYITAAVAIRKSMSVYANDTTDDGIIDDHADLSSNLTGQILPANKGLSAVLGNPEKLRAHRRGIMARITGSIQAAPIHGPRKIVTDIEDVTPDDFMGRLPFDISNLKFEDIRNGANKLICPDENPLLVCDVPKPPRVNMASALNIVWENTSLPDVVETISEDTPLWKKVAIKQVRNLKGEQANG